VTAGAARSRAVLAVANVMGSSKRRKRARAFGWSEHLGRRLCVSVAVAFILLAAVVNATQDNRIVRTYGAQAFTFTILIDEVLPRGEVIRHIEPVFITPRGPITEFIDHVLPAHDRWSWLVGNLVRDIELYISPGYEDRIRELRLTMGERDVPVSLSRGEMAERNGRTMLRRSVVLPESEIRRSVLAADAGFVNWPGDLAIAGRIGAFVALWGGLLGAIVLWARLPAFAGVWRSLSFANNNDRLAEYPSAHRGGALLWFWGGFGAVLVTLAVLQWRDPYYFTQDDNLSQFLPVILAGGQSLFAGVLFDYNPFQLMGAPTVEVGTYALTYPGTYLAYGLARIAGNENLTLEIFCIAHLLPGFAATWWAARRWGAGGAMAAALGVCFVLSGYALVAGRSWYYMTPVFLWLPLALAALHGVMFRERKTGDTLLLGLSLGLLFHAGNAQMWLYAAAMAGTLALLLWWREGFRRRAFTHLAAAGLGTLGLIMPLLLPQFEFAAQALRSGGGGFDISHSITSLFNPLPLGVTDMNFRTAPPFVMELGAVYYSGPLLIIAGLLTAFLTAALWLGGGSGGRRISLPGLLALGGAAAFLLACGYAGPLWWFHMALPVLEKFTHPVKFVPFAILLLGLAAILAWERLRLPEQMKSRMAALFAVGAFGLMFWNAMRTHERAFHYFQDDPYPGVTQPVTAPRQHEARLFPMSPMRSSYAGFVKSGNLNFAMLYGELSLWGYDPFIWAHPRFESTLTGLIQNPAQILREAGVSRLAVWQEFPAVLPEIFSSDSMRPWQADIAALLRASGAPLPELDGERRVRGDVAVPGAMPLAYMAGEPSRSWPVTVAGPHVSVAFAGQGWPGGELVLSFLAYARTVVTADGRTVPHRADGFGRVVAPVPAGARQVRLGYAIDWARGLGWAIALLGLAAYVLWQFDGPGRRERDQS
jgi:hypothetical protein